MNCVGCSNNRRDKLRVVMPLIRLLHAQFIAWTDVEEIATAIQIVSKHADDMLWEHKHICHNSGGVAEVNSK